MATDPKTKPVRWEFDLHEKDFVARSHPLPVPSTGIFDEVNHCVVINVQWLPHVIGAFQILVESDSWAGGDEEIFRAQQEVQKLISTLSQPCSDGENMLIPEFRTIEIDSRCDQNQWKYTVEPDDAWRNLGTPVCDGIDGDDGENGAPGEDGADGAPGADGEDCDCSTVPPEPTEPDTSVNNCAGSFGVAQLMLDTLNYNLDQMDFYGVIGTAVIDTITFNLRNTLEALPFIGLVVTWVEAAYAIGVGSIRIETGYPEFVEEVACMLYCAVETEGAFNTNSFNAWISEMESQGVNTFYVQLIRDHVGFAPLSRKYAIYSLNADSRCEALCECGVCADPLTHDFRGDPANDWGWDLVTTGDPTEWNCGTVDFAGTSWMGSLVATEGFRLDEPSGSGFQGVMRIKYQFVEGGHNVCKIDVLIGNSSGSTNTRQTTLWVKRVGSSEYENLECKRLGVGNGSDPSLHWEGDMINADEIVIVVAVGAATMWIRQVELNVED